MTVLDRFFDKVQMEPNTGCWLWEGAISTNGYGRFVQPDSKSQSAHRFSYKTHVGPIPHGLDLDHLCRVRCCVNPEHLEPVTRSENCKRGETVDHLRVAMLSKTHCPHGHPYSGENLFININGQRRCRACRDSQNRKQYARRCAAKTSKK